MRLYTLLAGATLGSTLLASSAARAVTTVYGITQDTYLDSGVPNNNEGANTKVKAVDNPASTDFPGATSTTRALFDLPTTFWTAVDAAVAANVPFTATVSYVAANNSLSGYYNGGHVNGPSPRDIELHPMTSSWTPGTANNTVNVAGIAGATWNTSDGTTPWTNTTAFPVTTYTSTGSTTTTNTHVGGDYDIADEVLEQNATVASGVAFTWDISSLIVNPTTHTDLETDGALLKITNDTTYDTDNDIQYFASLASADSGTKPFVTLVVAPEPCAALLLGVGGVALLSKRTGRDRIGA